MRSIVLAMLKIFVSKNTQKMITFSNFSIIYIKNDSIICD